MNDRSLNVVKIKFCKVDQRKRAKVANKLFRERFIDSKMKRNNIRKRKEISDSKHGAKKVRIAHRKFNRLRIDPFE